jgi:hypothetical protein
MFRSLILFAVMLLLPAGAYAAGKQCYTPEELDAEQMLRLHSELMVITVTCHQASDGEDLVPHYTHFTKANLPLIQSAEHTMAHYYRVNYGGDGLARLDKLRTELANEYGQETADISAPVFCGDRRDKVVKMDHKPPADVNDEVLLMAKEHKSYVHLCRAAK